MEFSGSNGTLISTIYTEIVLFLAVETYMYSLAQIGILYTFKIEKNDQTNKTFQVL